ncbi:MAG: acyltransferase, partial [bacterium]|nr:acyltransferase [bacterium]
MSSIGKTELQARLTEDGRSPLANYMEMVLGQGGLAGLLRYEASLATCGSIPGAAGFFLRSRIYPGLMGRVGRKVFFGRDMVLRHPQKICLGNSVYCDDYTVLDAKGSDNRGISVGDNVIIGRATVLSCKNGDIEIGENTNIAMNCFIQSSKRVVIGANVLIAPYCYLIGGGSHRHDRTDIPIMAQGQQVRELVIGDDVWLGAGVKVMDGLTIGSGSIIGAGAVVTRDIPPYSIAVGMPARVI